MLSCPYLHVGKYLIKSNTISVSFLFPCSLTQTPPNWYFGCIPQIRDICKQITSVSPYIESRLDLPEMLKSKFQKCFKSVSSWRSQKDILRFFITISSFFSPIQVYKKSFLKIYIFEYFTKKAWINIQGDYFIE